MTSTDSIPNSHESWTAREIAQQPRVWRQLAETLERRRHEIEAFMAPLLAQPELRVVLTGAGTSAFAGQILAPGLARQLRQRVDAIATTDLVSNPHEHFAQDVPTLLVSFARSGDSPESVAALEHADALLTRCHHLVLTCNPEGHLYRRLTDAPTGGPGAGLALLMPEGTNDRGFAMTSSVTSMLLAALSVLGGHRDLERLADAAEEALSPLAAKASTLLDQDADRFVYLGSGPFAGLARESALKLLELTAGQVVSYFDTALGFRHGPKAVLTPGTIAIVYMSNDPYTRRYDFDIAAELRAALPAGQVITVGCAGDAEQETWSFPSLADLPDIAVAAVLLVGAQHVALAQSVARGFNPDNPFPGNDVNRVVQGVSIHELGH